METTDNWIQYTEINKIEDKNIDDERKIKMVSKKVKSNIRKRTDFNE